MVDEDRERQIGALYTEAAAERRIARRAAQAGDFELADEHDRRARKLQNEVCRLSASG